MWFCIPYINETNNKVRPSFKVLGVKFEKSVHFVYRRTFYFTGIQSNTICIVGLCLDSASWNEFNHNNSGAAPGLQRLVEDWVRVSPARRPGRVRALFPFSGRSRSLSAGLAIRARTGLADCTFDGVCHNLACISASVIGPISSEVHSGSVSRLVVGPITHICPLRRVLKTVRDISSSVLNRYY